MVAGASASRDAGAAADRTVQIHGGMLDRAALWPFAHGGSCPGYGAAIVTQSGMLSSDLTMSQRSVPFAFMASIGNQSVVTLADCVDVFAGFRGVRAIGLHVEDIPDVAEFSEAVRKAVGAGIPVVALKTGVSEIGARLTVSHTGALSGDDDLYQALFDRLGVIRVSTPAQLVGDAEVPVRGGRAGREIESPASPARAVPRPCSPTARRSSGYGFRRRPGGRPQNVSPSACPAYRHGLESARLHHARSGALPEHVGPVFETMFSGILSMSR